MVAVVGGLVMDKEDVVIWPAVVGGIAVVGAGFVFW